MAERYVDHEAMNKMIASFAVLEQLVLNLVFVVSEDYEDPLGFRKALIEDLRLRFDATRLPPDQRGRVGFYAAATRHIDRIEPRIVTDPMNGSR